MKKIKQMDELPIYIKIEILVQAPNEEFVTLCRLNKELYYLYSGIIPFEIFSVHGNLSERMYKLRSERIFDKNVYLLKNENANMTWKEFYRRVQLFYSKSKQKSISCIIEHAINTCNNSDSEFELEIKLLEYDNSNYLTLYNLNNKFDVNYYIKRAARYLQFETMEWIFSWYNRYVYNSNNLLNCNIKIDIDIDLLRKTPMLLSSKWRNVTDDERIKILEWYESKGVYPNLEDYRDYNLKNRMNEAVKKWIDSHVNKI